MPSLVRSHERPSLYLSEPDFADLVLLPTKACGWPDITAVLEREGLPHIDPIMGGRCWPAVRAWLDRRHGLRKGHVAGAAAIHRAEIVKQIYDQFVGDDEGTQA